MSLLRSHDMGLLARLDRFAHATHLDVLTPYGERRPRNLRWLPLYAMIALAAGYGLWVAALRQAVPPWLGLTGATFFSVALLHAALLPLWGPSEESGSRLDERDRSIQDRSGHVAGRILELAVVLACAYFAFALLLGLWMPATPAEWGILALAAGAAPRLLRLLIASRMQPPPISED